MTLSATGLVKRYSANSDYLAVDGADLEIASGEFVAIIGQSGSGKSTLLAMLGALTRPSKGQVIFEGLPNLRAVDNVALPALLAGSMDAEAANAAAFRLLDRVGLRDRSHSFPAQLSGGEQRRVVI